MDKELVIIVLSVVITVAIVIGGTFGTGYFLEKYVICPRIGEQLDMPYEYNFWAGGCYVQMDDGQWVRMANYRGVSIED